MDLVKAFDTVFHDILFGILSNNDVRGAVLNIFKNYSSNHWQFVKIRNFSNDPQAIKMAVPQDTIPGPVLFN